MGIKHLKVMGDSNLVVCQTKGSFSLKEPSLVLYRTMAQKMEEKFSTFEIDHAPRNENRYTDALPHSTLFFFFFKKWYVHTIFTIFLQQILNGRLLLLD